jgi:hypothetical protein
LSGGGRRISFVAMKMGTGILFVVLLAMPAIGWSQAESARAETTPMTGPAKPANAAPAFRASDPGVRELLRAWARIASQPATSSGTEPALTRTAALLQASIKAPRRVDRLECGALTCYARSRDGELLYSKPRDWQQGGVSVADSTSDAWLSCQDTNNMLSTFDRYDACRGISLGSPMPWTGVGIARTPL